MSVAADRFDGVHPFERPPVLRRPGERGGCVAARYTSLVHSEVQNRIGTAVAVDIPPPLGLGACARRTEAHRMEIDVRYVERLCREHGDANQRMAPRIQSVRKHPRLDIDHSLNVKRCRMPQHGVTCGAVGEKTGSNDLTGVVGRNASLSAPPSVPRSIMPPAAVHENAWRSRPGPRWSQRPGRHR